tara:strand:- start:411 stop:629 length:219 start_codon:yes stop_codon:yes gene_type:complete
LEENNVDFKKYAEDTLKTYQEELKRAQEAINSALAELDALKKTEQRLLGAIASLNDMVAKESKEKEDKKAKA